MKIEIYEEFVPKLNFCKKCKFRPSRFRDP